MARIVTPLGKSESPGGRLRFLANPTHRDRSGCSREQTFFVTLRSGSSREQPLAAKRHCSRRTGGDAIRTDVGCAAAQDVAAALWPPHTSPPSLQPPTPAVQSRCVPLHHPRQQVNEAADVFCSAPWLLLLLASSLLLPPPPSLRFPLLLLSSMLSSFFLFKPVILGGLARGAASCLALSCACRSSMARHMCPASLLLLPSSHRRRRC